MLTDSTFYSSRLGPPETLRQALSSRKLNFQRHIHSLTLRHCVSSDKVITKDHPKHKIINEEVAATFVKELKFTFKTDINSSIYKIPNREGGQLISMEDSVLFLGGKLLIGSKFDIRFFDLKKLSLRDKFQFDGLPQTGFSADMIAQDIYIFGGSRNILSIKQCSKDCFLLRNRQIQSKSFKGSKSLVPRRNHAHSVINNFIVLSGGISQRQNYLNDIFYLDVAKQKWSGRFKLCDKGLAFHKSELITLKNRRFLVIFGGKQIYNDFLQGLYQVNLNQVQPGQFSIEPMQLMRLRGAQAPPRYEHTMHFIPKISSLLIIGGRNNERVLGIEELYIVQFQMNSWYVIRQKGDPFHPLYGHSSTFDGSSKVYVFGGMVSYSGGITSFVTNRLSYLQVELKEDMTKHLFSDMEKKRRTKIRKPTLSFVPRPITRKNVVSLNNLIKEVFQSCSTQTFTDMNQVLSSSTFIHTSSLRSTPPPNIYNYTVASALSSNCRGSTSSTYGRLELNLNFLSRFQRFLYLQKIEPFCCFFNFSISLATGRIFATDTYSFHILIYRSPLNTPSKQLILFYSGQPSSTAQKCPQEDQKSILLLGTERKAGIELMKAV